METIEFRKFTIKKGYIETTVTTSKFLTKQKDIIKFGLNKKIIPNSDLIAVALSTLCGTQYKNIYMDLLVSTEALEGIKKFTQANVTVKGENLSPPTYKNGTNNIILNFSGGFDSLAALCIMPDNTKLVSIDFGHWFTREKEIFSKFAPYTVKTNFRHLKYDRASWTFMGAGAILYSEYLGAGYQVFGTNLESTPWNYISPDRINKSALVPPFSIANIKDIKYIQGLALPSIIMIISRYRPDLLNESLKSLSEPGTEKRYRKEIVAKFICKKYNRNVRIESTAPPKQKVKFGSYLTADFIILYQLKFLGLEVAELTISDIPQDAKDLVAKLTLNFYEKVNTNFLETIPIQYRENYLTKLANAEILPYNEQDWEEFREVIKLLSKYHTSITNVI